MSNSKRVVLAVLGLLFLFNPQACLASPTGVASVSAVLERPIGGGGGDAGAAWAAAAALPFLGYPFSAFPTGFSSPMIYSPEKAYIKDYSNKKFLVAFTPDGTTVSDESVQQALKGNKQPNIVVYELQMNPDFSVKKPKIYNKSFDKKLDKSGKYSAEFISNFIMDY